MNRFLIPLFLFVYYSSIFASDNLNSISAKFAECVINRDSISLSKLIPDSTFDYFTADIDAEFGENQDTTQYVLEKNGLYPYEIKQPKKYKKEVISFLTTDCAVAFNRSKYPIRMADFKKVNQLSKNRAELQLKALCDASGVHFVFIKNSKGNWRYAGYFFDAARVEVESH